jgi:hypothetical protein
MLPVFYSYEIFSHTLTEEFKLEVYESKEHKKIVSSKLDEINGKFRILCNVELHHLHRSWGNVVC